MISSLRVLPNTIGVPHPLNILIMELPGEISIPLVRMRMSSPILGISKTENRIPIQQPLVTVHIRLVILRQDQILHACPFSRTKHPTSRPTYKEDKSY